MTGSDGAYRDRTGDLRLAKTDSERAGNRIAKRNPASRVANHGASISRSFRSFTEDLGTGTGQCLNDPGFPLEPIAEKGPGA